MGHARATRSARYDHREVHARPALTRCPHLAFTFTQPSMAISHGAWRPPGMAISASLTLRVLSMGHGRLSSFALCGCREGERPRPPQSRVASVTGMHPASPTHETGMHPASPTHELHPSRQCRAGTNPNPGTTTAKEHGALPALPPPGASPAGHAAGTVTGAVSLASLDEAATTTWKTPALRTHPLPG